MTEQNSSNPVEQSTGQVMETSSVSTPAAEPQGSTQAEKLIPQSEVGKIAGASRKEGHDKGYEKGYQEALAKYQQQQAAPVAQTTIPAAQVSQSQPHTADNNNIAELVAKQVADTLRKEREESSRLLEEKRQQDYITQVATQIKPKIDAAREKYEDFQSSIDSLHLEKIPHLIEWVNSVPNAGEVLYDLAKNPHKLGILNSMHTPELALQQINMISNSLQNNQAAQNKSLPRDPLNSIQPSNVGKSPGPSTGQQLTDDARKKYRF